MDIEFLSEDELFKTCKSCDGPIMVMPFTQRSMAEQACDIAARRSGLKTGLIIAVEDIHRQGFIRMANSVYRQTISPWFGYFAQDAFPGRWWLSAAVQSLETTQTSLIGFNDGKWNGLLAAFGLVRRSWGDRNYDGDLFFPGYRSHYADTELTLLAMQDRQYTYNANSVLVEVDWNKDAAPVDPEDRKLFNGRKANRFSNRVTDPELLGLFK